MSGEPAFAIEIVRQGWITDTAESALWDYCSHGDVRVVVGGAVIAPGDGAGDFTISTSALALLRTLESDHSPDARVPEYLLLHCGQLEMTSCPASIDWSVTHLGDRVRLHDVVDANGRRLAELAVDLELDAYRRAVAAFAEKAKEPFRGLEKAFEEDDDYHRTMYERFWDEYDRLLATYAIAS